jgi:hypothetical protein
VVEIRKESRGGGGNDVRQTCRSAHFISQGKGENSRNRNIDACIVEGVTTGLFIYRRMGGRADRRMQRGVASGPSKLSGIGSDLE